MGALNNYDSAVRRMVHDQQVAEYVKADLVDYINQGRAMVAMEAKCIRKVPQNTVTVESQEVYPFSAIDLSPFPGCQSVFSVGSISVLFGNWQFTLRRVSFSRYQSWVRVYSTGFSDVPTIWSQVGDGDQAEAHLYPIANQGYQMYWDCYCLPIPLASDVDVEALPLMFQPAVKHYATFLAFSSMLGERYAALADRHLKLYRHFVQVGRAASETSFVSNWYGRR